jgi:hypothetical protein
VDVGPERTPRRKDRTSAPQCIDHDQAQEQVTMMFPDKHFPNMKIICTRN